MKRLLNILVLLVLAVSAFAQVDTRIVDSLQDAYATQEGEERIKTMLELAWDFYDISFDECIDWGEKALKEAETHGVLYLEAEANYTIGIQYGYHGDVDLAAHYLKKAYSQYVLIDDSEYIKNFGWAYSSVWYAFESLWNLATYELTLGNIDSAFQIYEKALPLAEQMNDTSAKAYVLVNMGLVWYKRNHQQTAYTFFEQAKRIFESIGDERMAIRMGNNMATICAENGQAAEALALFWSVIPKLEELGDYYHLLNVCSTIGVIYENEIVDYDSAMCYLEKALAYAEMPMRSKESEVLALNEKSETMVEMANVMLKLGESQAALAKYEEALGLAEKNAYLHGQMEACLGLGMEYGRLGQAAKSLQYFRRFFELEKASGVMMMRPSARKALAMDYARLGMYDELEAELADLADGYEGLLRENADINDQLRTLHQEGAELLEQYEAQSEALYEQQRLTSHYRLAFYGLLALVLSAAVLFLLYKIVCKNRVKMEKG